MYNMIFQCFFEAGEGEYVIKQYYHDANGKLMVRLNEFIKVQHGYDLSYDRVDSFDYETSLNDLNRDLLDTENELKAAIKDILTTLNRKALN